MNADTYTTQTIRLIDPLPCSIWAPGNQPCGKPAFVAYAWPAEPQLRWPLPGLWTLQPVCAECAASAARAIEAQDAPPAPAACSTAHTDDQVSAS